MRLSPEQIATIRAAARETFGPDARVWLFGSRVDDSALGGDIDLLISSDSSIPDRERKRLRFVARLQLRLGDQPIDALVLDPNVPRQPIRERALHEGVPL
ncbi:MAG: nucleotidyltransferase domain-containing protein [Pseudomonadota bacterium]